MTQSFQIKSNFKPAGDQPEAIQALTDGLKKTFRFQTLLGVTGSGKTFTMAHVIQNWNHPALIIAHNKTLAAQLYGEFKQLFPDHAVEYFVSYYDYYQPEAYIPGRDLYIEKSSLINDEIERMRLSATRALFERNDVIIVASVSAIYGLGSADAYYKMVIKLEQGEDHPVDQLARDLVKIKYSHNKTAFERGHFRILGDVVEIFPAYESDIGIRLEYFGDTLEGIYEIDPLSKKMLRTLKHAAIYPATHFTVDESVQKVAISAIQDELEKQLVILENDGKLVEHQRLKERTLYDIEMIEETGSCSGIENYSRHFTRLNPGDPPPTLLDYFPKEGLIMVDESHATLPQIRGMYLGDRSRKTTLVNFGFRLPSALDNRPLKFEEFMSRAADRYLICVSATPADYERENSQQIATQIIRPTGLLDPELEVRPVKGSVDDLYGEASMVIEKGFKVLVTTLTKKMAEHLTDYYKELGIRVRYLHSDIDTIERVKILNALQNDEFDLLVGVNLLREGLDLPGVALVAILDADQEGFLRSERSLIQTFGRAARNVEGRVVMYADKITNSMRKAIDETNRRRTLQHQDNIKNGITPKTIVKRQVSLFQKKKEEPLLLDEVTFKDQIDRLTKKMKEHAKKLDFESAAALRDQIQQIQQQQLFGEGGKKRG